MKKCLVLFACLFGAIIQTSDTEFITIAILAKDKAHTLPLLLKCIENQTWPKEQTYIYIRTNNNNDNTEQILKNWVDKVKDLYPRIYFNAENVKTNLEQYKQHDWNGTRFKILGKIRQDSVDWAYQNNSHYFVVDCDNFIKPHTLKSMFLTHLPIVAPFLKCPQRQYYSNYHADIDENGYFKNCALYYDIYNQRNPGLYNIPVIHCTYFIEYKYLPLISYDDNSARYEYVIFSDNARKHNIDQTFDNREVYGYLTFAETVQEFEADPTKSLVESWFK